MFLLYGGNAFIMKLSYGEPSEPLGVVFDNKIVVQNVTYEASQGMRVYHNQHADHYAIAIAMAETPGSFQFGAASTTTTGQLNWAQMFVAERGGHDGHESHPYTMVVPEDGSGYVVGGHSVIYDSKHVELCQGRLIKIDPRGKLLFDRRFQAAQRDTNIECYGVDSTSDGGLIVTCGMGVEPELHPDDSRELQTWMVLIHRTDAFGHTLWQANFTTNQQYFSNAGEFVLHTRSGDVAAFFDSQTWGSRDTDGNFGLMKLARDWTEAQAKKGQTLVDRSASATLDRDEPLEIVNLDTPVVFSGGREKPVTLVLLSPALVARAKLAAEGAEPSSFPRIARLLGSEGRQQPLMPAGLEVPTPVPEAHVERATSGTS